MHSPSNQVETKIGDLEVGDEMAVLVGASWKTTYSRVIGWLVRRNPSCTAELLDYVNFTTAGRMVHTVLYSCGVQLYTVPSSEVHTQKCTQGV